MRRRTHWQVPSVLAAASVLAAIAGAAGQHALRYERSAIADGEVWRLLTGHIAHLNLAHLVLNLAGLVLVWLLVGGRFSRIEWWLVIAATIAVIDCGFWILDPGLGWYVGLSGLLHGLLIAGVMRGFREAPGESLALGLLVALKIVYEQFAGPLPGSEASAGGPVVVNAHLYGAVGGAIAGFWARISDLRTASL